MRPIPATKPAVAPRPPPPPIPPKPTANKATPTAPTPQPAKAAAPTFEQRWNALPAEISKFYGRMVIHIKDPNGSFQKVLPQVQKGVFICVTVFFVTKAPVYCLVSMVVGAVVREEMKPTLIKAEGVWKKLLVEQQGLMVAAFAVSSLYAIPAPVGAVIMGFGVGTRAYNRL